LQERAASRWPNSWTIIASPANPINEIIIDIFCNRPAEAVSRPVPIRFCEDF